MVRNMILLILVTFLTVMSVSAQTHNIRRGSGTSANTPRTSITTKRSSTSTATKKTDASNSREHSSTATSQNKKQTTSSSRERLSPVIQNLINNMVYVDGGTFTMGATSEQGNDAYENEKPTHQVTLTSFYIGRYEVTQVEWMAVMGSNPSYFQSAKRPVEEVSWDDCQKFIHKLNSLTGMKFRLPTEAEWEFAARGGNNSRKCKYSGSNVISSVAWIDVNSGKSTSQVGQRTANELGLYYMSGNVREWCEDRYDNYIPSSQINLQGPSSGVNRVTRGGSWNLSDSSSRVSNRSYCPPSYSFSYLGLRIAL